MKGMTALDYGITVLRVFLGLLFIGHGTQKLFGWFGGGGMRGTRSMMDKLGVRPAQFWAWVNALAETLGGVGLFLGFLTPLAGAAIIGSMLMAIARVHWKNGLWNSKGGIEFPLMLAIQAAFLGLFGPGALALDSLLDLAYPKSLTFLVALALSVLSVLIAMATIQSPIRQEASHAKQA